MATQWHLPPLGVNGLKTTLLGRFGEPPHMKLLAWASEGPIMV